MRQSWAIVYAFDTNEEALRLCRRMAEVNGVVDRLRTGHLCDAETLRGIPFREKALIMCDAEGYERDLFSREVALALAPHDFLIEVHDGLDLSISAHLREVFRQTHELEAIAILNDVKRVQTCNYGELDEYDLPTRRILVSEGRRNSTEWFLLTSRQKRL